MIGFIMKKIIGSQNERALKKLEPLVASICLLEEEMAKLNDGQLKEKTLHFRDRLGKGETLDDLLPEAFAVVREVGKRTLNMRHFDVQLMGGIILHQGKIADLSLDCLKPYFFLNK